MNKGSNYWCRKDDPKITKELLIDLYHNKGQSLKEIARKYGHTLRWYHTRFKEYGIEERPYKDKQKPDSNKYKAGDKIGQWTILDGPVYIEKPNNKFNKRVTGYICQCICKKEKILTINCLNGSNNCGCIRNNKRFKGFKGLTGTFIGDILKKKRRNGEVFESNVTPKYLYELLEKQNFRCALSGVPISLYSREDVRIDGGKGNLSCTASLDRIDSTKGYIEGNVQWVHKFINIMKWDLGQEEFVYFCRKVSKNMKSTRKLSDNEEQNLINRKLDRKKNKNKQ